MRCRAASGLLALGWLACSPQSLAPPAQLQGTNGLALFGTLLFITSTESNELKVLDIGNAPRDFVRAPNPLEPLSIPVLDRPIDLARDLTYAGGTNGGMEAAGPYLYVRGQSSAELSIVGTDPKTQLLELRRLLTSGIVTAIAARGPSNPSDSSTLYYATADTPRCLSAPDGGPCTSFGGSQATLWQASIPAADSNGRLPAAAGIAVSPQWTFESIVTALAILPSPSTLAVATRTQPGAPDGGTIRGRTVILNLDGRVERPLTAFPTSLRFLATNPSSSALFDAGAGAVPTTQDLPAGSRIYGILDESACDPDGGYACPALLSVDTDAGTISLDATLTPMLPLNFGQALPMSVALAPNVLIPVPNQDPNNGLGPFVRNVRYPLLGFVPASNGNTYFFDATGLIPINGSLNIGGAAVSAVQYFGSDGGQLNYFEGPIKTTVVVTTGYTRDEHVFITYQGVVTGFQNLPLLVDGGLSARANLFDGRVGPGDQVVLFGSGCPDYSGTDQGLGVAGTDNDAGLIRIDGGLPPGCSPSTFSVRAGGTQLPYVVASAATGYMGRAGEHRDFQYDGGLFFHPPCTPANLLGCPLQIGRQLQFSFDGGDPDIQRDYAYLIATISGLEPEFVQIDTSGAFLGVEYRLPTNVVNVATLPDGGTLDRFFVAYPAANAVVEFDPANVTPNTAAILGIARYN